MDSKKNRFSSIILLQIDGDERTNVYLPSPELVKLNAKLWQRAGQVLIGQYIFYCILIGLVCIFLISGWLSELSLFLIGLQQFFFSYLHVQCRLNAKLMQRSCQFLIGQTFFDAFWLTVPLFSLFLIGSIVISKFPIGINKILDFFLVGQAHC